jgi:hypothetical protein
MLSIANECSTWPVVVMHALYGQLIPSMANECPIWPVLVIHALPKLFHLYTILFLYIADFLVIYLIPPVHLY